MFRGLKALIAGILAGTAIGVLFSPKSGEETRKSFKSERSKGGTGLNTLKETATALGKDLKDTAGEICDEVADSKEWKEGVQEVKKQYKKRVPKKTQKKVKKAVKDTKKTVEKTVKRAKKGLKK